MPKAIINILACRAGGPETAHQIINSGAEERRYLALDYRDGE